MHGIHPLIIDLMLISIYATITTIIFKKLKQPMVLGYLLAGIFAGPYFNFVPTVSDRANLSLWADIGVIFLLFSLGLEFSFKKMISVGKSAVITATLNIFLLLFCGYYVGLFLGLSTIDSFFLGSMISMSSTTIIIKAFDDLNIKKQKFTDLVFGVLVLEDIMGVLMLVLLPMIAIGKGIDGGALGLNALKLFIFLILCFVFGIHIVPTVLKKLKDFLNDEMLLLMAISLSLSMVFLAVYFGFSSALGAFIMGSILSETGVVHRIENVIKPLKDFFGAVFFVTVGMTVNPEMIIEYAYPIFVITLVVMIGQVVFSIFGLVISGQTLKTAVSCGFSLAQVGEFAFIIASLGMSLKVLDEYVYPIIVAVSVITTFFTPIMIRSSDYMYKFMNKILPEKWLKYIDQTSKSSSTLNMEEKLWRSLFKNYFLRIFLFSLIIFAFIGFSNQVLRPFIYSFLPNIPARILLTLITLVVIAPFLKGLIGWNLVLPHNWKNLLPKIRFRNNKNNNLNASDISEEKLENETVTCENNVLHGVWQKNFTAIKFFISDEKISKIYTALWCSKKANRLPLLILTSFRLFLVSFFIVTTVHQFLTENTKAIFVLLIASIFLISRSNWLLNQYLKIENQFLDNLNGELPSNNEDEKAKEK